MTPTVILIFLLAFSAVLLTLSLKKREKSTLQKKIRELENALSEQRLLHARTDERFLSTVKEKDGLLQAWNVERSELKDELFRQQKKNTELIREIENKSALLHAESEKLASQRRDLEETKERFNKEFELIANRILEEKTNHFSRSNLSSLDQILQPFKENIKNFEEKINQVYLTESNERNTLKGVIHALVDQSRQIQDEAQNLARALKGDNKQQGNWGEMILEKILDRSGLVKGTEYSIQKSYTNEQGRRFQPDVVINLPDQKHLVIDAKVSMVAYEKLINADDEKEKSIYSKQHLDSVKAHILNLSSKNYADLFQINSPDFVLLFMPIESSFGLTVSIDNEIFNYAWERKVVIVSPSTLFATLRTIASIWKQDRQNRNVMEIAHESGLLYDKFAGFIEDFSKIEKQILSLSRTHEDARKKLELGRGNIISRFEKLKVLGAKTNKILDEQYGSGFR